MNKITYEELNEAFIKHKITYEELKEAFIKHNRENGITAKSDNNPLIGVIVFKPKESHWKKDYWNCSLKCRSYKTSSCNKAYIDGQLGYSIFAENLEDGDLPRLEGLMKDEKGGEDGWVVDYCYLMETKNENSKNI